MAARPKAVAPTVKQTEKAPVEHIEGIYAILLCGYLTLKDEHRRQLRARGLTDGEIIRLNFKSTPHPMAGDCIVQALADYGLEGVPGFYFERDRWRLAEQRPGFFIPIKSAEGRLVGLQVRRADVSDGRGKYVWFSSNGKHLGVSSGAPVHYANWHLLADGASQVLVTEGALKANVIACLSGLPVIGVAGVSNFGADFATKLKANFPAVREVVIAYDRDLMEKPQVYDALLRLSAQLERERFRVKVRTWPTQYKGLDDYLAAQIQTQEVAA
ncbi:MAG: DUF3854 domain-containing protein [Pyrinomonadaceae bacterium]